MSNSSTALRDLFESCSRLLRELFETPSRILRGSFEDPSTGLRIQPNGPRRKAEGRSNLSQTSLEAICKPTRMDIEADTDLYLKIKLINNFILTSFL